MYHIVLSGGPCAGKTTALSLLKSNLMSFGYQVFIVPETATILIENGIRPNYFSIEEFQSNCIKMQIANENLFRDAADRYAKEHKTDKVVIIYDRSLLDNFAYIDKKFVVNTFKENGLSYDEVLKRYDIILHLQTAAIGTNAYTTANNEARTETKEEAREAERKTLAANKRHPNLHIITNKGKSFEEKIIEVLKKVYALVGIHTSPSEMERKFLIKKPTKQQLAKLNCTSVTEITQTYLRIVSNDSSSICEQRIRKRGTEKIGYSYYFAEKLEDKNSPIKRVKRERIISSKEYETFRSNTSNELYTLHKTRYCFVYENQFMELDIYPFDTRRAIVEVELNSLSDPVTLPDFLDVIKEVTDDEYYKNHNLAKQLSNVTNLL